MSTLQSMPTFEQLVSTQTVVNSPDNLNSTCDSIPVINIPSPNSNEDWFESFLSSLMFSDDMEDTENMQHPITDENQDPVSRALSLSGILPSTTEPVSNYLASTVKEALCCWDLGLGVYAYLKLRHGKLRVYIWKFLLNDQNELVNSNEGITLSPTTWSEFSKKLGSFNVLYADTSFVSRNELFCFNHGGKLHLQKIIQLYDSKFCLTQCCIVLNQAQVALLKNCVDDISTALRKSIFTDWLPTQILKIKDSITFVTASVCDEKFAFQYLMTCIYENALCQVGKLFKCVGCVHEITEESYHECIHKTPLEMYNSISSEVLLNLDINSIVKRSFLQGAETFYWFDRNFFKTLKLEDYESALINLFQENV